MVMLTRETKNMLRHIDVIIKPSFSPEGYEISLALLGRADATLGPSLAIASSAIGTGSGFVVGSTSSGGTARAFSGRFKLEAIVIAN